MKEPLFMNIIYGSYRDLEPENGVESHYGVFSLRFRHEFHAISLFF